MINHKIHYLSISSQSAYLCIEHILVRIHNAINYRRLIVYTVPDVCKRNILKYKKKLHIGVFQLKWHN